MADEFPPDYGTDVGMVRALIPDNSTEDGTANTDYVFSDDHLNAFLTIESGNVKRAAAHAMIALANDMALVLKHIRTYDLAVNGAAVAEALQKSAVELRKQADREADSDDLEDAFIITNFNDGICYPEGAVMPVYGRLMGVAECR